MNTLFEQAKKAQQNAYSPYSKVKVGAAVLTENGTIHSGCNIENSSYGGSTCAEQVAILSAISQGHRQIQKICIITDASPPWPPCGICRQMMAEFMDENAVLELANPNGVQSVHTLKEFLPHAFTPQHLKT